MENLNLFPPWKRAVKSLLEAGLTYGSVVKKENIASLCGLQGPTTIAEKTDYDLQMLCFVTEIRKTLLSESNMLLASNFDGSYRVIEPREQTTFAVEYGARSIAREMKRMADGVGYVNLALLDQDERRRNMDAKAKISMLAGMQKTSDQELLRLVAA